MMNRAANILKDKEPTVQWITDADPLDDNHHPLVNGRSGRLTYPPRGFAQVVSAPIVAAVGVR